MKVDDKIRELLEKAECVEHFYIKGEEFSILERRLYQKALSLLPKPCEKCGGSGEVKPFPIDVPKLAMTCPACSPAGEIEAAKIAKVLRAHLDSLITSGWDELKKDGYAACTHLEALLKQIKGLEKTNNEFADGIETVNAACVKKTRLLQAQIKKLEGAYKKTQAELINYSCGCSLTMEKIFNQALQKGEAE